MASSGDLLFEALALVDRVSELGVGIDHFPDGELHRRTAGSGFSTRSVDCCAMPPFSETLTPGKALIFRITHRDNAPWILENGFTAANPPARHAESM
jgi:hypothetical protein